jgi:hypothetical protein
MFMSSAILADPFGQFLVHSAKHDLEGFWWSMLYVTINCEGPYNQLVDFHSNRFQRAAAAVGKSDRPTDPLFEPPTWLRNGLQTMSYQDILIHRLTSLRNWKYYSRLVHPFWHDEAILRGLKELFHIFMTDDLIIEEHGRAPYDPSKAADIVYKLPLEDEAIQVRPLTLSTHSH